jgi:hypothetical protein
MAFIQDYGQTPIEHFQRRGTVSKSYEKSHPIEIVLLQSGRIVLTMMATSKHPIKQQDEVMFIAAGDLPIGARVSPAVDLAFKPSSDTAETPDLEPSTKHYAIFVSKLPWKACSMPTITKDLCRSIPKCF